MNKLIDMINSSPVVQEIIFDSLKWFFIIGACTGVIVGIILFFKPEYFPKWNQKLNYWYSSRRTLKPFEIMRETDSYVYKRNSIWGGIMLVGSGLFLYHYFTWQFPEGAMQMFVSTLAMAILVEGLIIAVRLFLAVFIIAGLPVWILLIFYPDLLKRVSKMFNLWLSTRLVMLPFIKMHFEIDNWVLKYNQLFGVAFVLGSFFILFTFLFRV